MNLAEFRKEYSSRGLRREELAPDPVTQFSEWFNQATELEVHEPNALTLATVDEEGMPHQRTVLLKYYDPQGFVFFTNYSSKKAKTGPAHRNGRPLGRNSSVPAKNTVILRIVNAATFRTVKRCDGK